jgi:hypothetical protein
MGGGEGGDTMVVGGGEEALVLEEADFKLAVEEFRNFLKVFVVALCTVVVSDTFFLISKTSANFTVLATGFLLNPNPIETALVILESKDSLSHTTSFRSGETFMKLFLL